MNTKENGNSESQASSEKLSSEKGKAHISGKRVAAIALVVALLIAPIISLSTSISIGISQGVAVLEALDDPVEENDFQFADDPYVGLDASGYYSLYHAKAAFLLEQGGIPTNIALPAGISKPYSLGGNAKVYLEIYQLMNEICMRDEVNPYIESAWDQEEPLHTECTLGVITPEYLIGKLMSESSMYVDADAAIGGTPPTTALYWFTHNFIINSVTGSGISKEEFLKWTGSDSIDRLGFLADYTNRDEPSHFAVVVSAFYSDGMGGSPELEASLISNLKPCGPFGQLIGMSGNWQSPNNPSAGIYISRLENPDLHDSMRGIWGLREGYYKVTNEHEPDEYNKYVYSPWANSSSLSDLEGYDENGEHHEGYLDQGNHAHYTNSITIWSDGPDACDIAYYGEVSSNIRQGNMNLSNPVGWQSRPAVYYLPDSMYTLCMHLRATMQGARLSTLRYGSMTNKYSTYQGISGMSDFKEWNDRILFLAAATQHLPSDADEDGIAHQLILKTSGRIREQAKNEYPDSAYCGAFNLRNGEEYHPAFKAVIDGLWSSGGYSDTDLQKYVGVYVTPQKPSAPDGDTPPNYPDGDGDREPPGEIISSSTPGISDPPSSSTATPGSPNRPSSSSSSSSSKPTSPARPSSSASSSTSSQKPSTPVSNTGSKDFVWPLNTSYNRMTSIFGKGAGNFGYVASDHGGIDIGGCGDQSILAAAPGKVVVANSSCEHDWAKYQSCCGNGLGDHVVIDHGGGIYTTYGHMRNGTMAVQVGDKVTAGQIIGKVGCTGHSTGEHLHFAVSYDYMLTSAYYIEPLAHTFTNMTLSQLSSATYNEGISRYLDAYSSVGVLPCLSRYGDPYTKRNVKWR